MRRPGKSRAVEPDRHYQLPHPDLVSVPPALLERTRQHLLSYMDLWERLGAVSAALARDLRELESAGGCPDDLAAALSWAVSLYLRSHDEVVKEGETIEGKDSTTAVNRYTDRERDHSSSSAGVVKGGTPSDQVTALVRYLEEIGYRGAEEDIERYGLERMAAAVDYARSRKVLSVQDLARYVRWAVARGIVAAPPAPPQSKYFSGRYGHVVKG